MRSRAVIGFLIAISVVSCDANARDTCGDPVATAKKLFESSKSFYYRDPPHDLLTEEFYQAIAKEIRCLDANGLCTLDYDPWTGAQDGEIGEPVKFELEPSVGESGRSKVKMEYPYKLGPGYDSKQHVVHLLLDKEQNGCWKVKDLITPIGDSLLNLLSQHIE